MTAATTPSTALLFFLVGAASAFNTTNLLGGAALSVNITSPVAADPQVGPLRLQGTASIDISHPEVSYVYIIDSSSSTSAFDAPCASVLDCVQEFFRDFHNETLHDGSAALTAVIDFDSTATLATGGFVHPQNDVLAIHAAIEASDPTGFTECRHALNMAAGLVNSSANTAETTVVVFAGDGACTDTYPEDLEEAIQALKSTGAIVHTVAVGDSVNCTDSQGASNDLDNIPQNGGRCTSVPDPHTLPHIIDDLIGTELSRLEAQLDQGPFAELLPGSTLSRDLPLDGPVEVAFDSDLGALAPGPHQACVHASGSSALGGDGAVEDCVDFVVAEEPTASPTAAPTLAPTPRPSRSPSQAPSAAPTQTRIVQEKLEAGAMFGVVACVLVAIVVSLWAIRRVWVRRATKTETAAAGKDLALEEGSFENKSSDSKADKPELV